MTEDRNPLYPIFLKLHKLKMLVVGAGEVGLEKMSFILKSSPDAIIDIVAPEIRPEIIDLIAGKENIRVHQRPFQKEDLIGKDLAVAATCFKELNQEVQQYAKEYGVLINVADTPDLCDFYLGSIVTRGNLKIGISTNGKSPTFAKRFRQLLEDILPDDSAELLLNLKEFRDRLKGDFEYKVKKLNELTADLLK